MTWRHRNREESLVYSLPHVSDSYRGVCHGADGVEPDCGKLISVGGLVLPAAVVLFPLTYIFGDVFTEVYGFRSPPSNSQRNTRCVASSGKYFLVIGW